MASYFSSLLTTTTSRVATLRQNLLPSENDGDTLDDTHICRVLRGYYTEKGRALPGWLPPDPKAPPPPVVVQPVFTSNVGAGYGGGINQTGPAGRGALSSLWDAQPQPQQQGRGRPFGAKSSGDGSRQNPFLTAKQQTSQAAEVQARPLPSQRAGSYQTAGAFSRDTPPGSSSGITSAKDKLIRSLGGARSASPAHSAPAQNNYAPASSGGDNYEDRFMPPENVDGGRRGWGGSERPFVAATSPWASNESEFGGGGYGGGYDAGGGQQSGRQGLPPGPAAGRRGLPNGPRGYR